MALLEINNEYSVDFTGSCVNAYMYISKRVQLLEMLRIRFSGMCCRSTKTFRFINFYKDSQKSPAISEVIVTINPAK